MRVLLVIPTHRYQFDWSAFVSLPDLPIGFAYLASTLRAAGHEVHALNLNNRPEFRSAREMVKKCVPRALGEFFPDVICTGGISADFACLRDIIHAVRATGQNIPIVLGGRIVTLDPEWVVNRLEPDFGIVGEGEYVLPELLDNIGSPQEIPNLYYWRSGKIAATKRDFGYPNLDGLPFPDLSIFGDWQRYAVTMRYLYRYPQANPRPMVLIAGRSCPFSCTFCVHATPIPYRARSIGNIMAELEQHHRLWQFNTLIILDELFAAKRERLASFSQAILYRGWTISWGFQTHSSARLDVDTLRLAKRAGCYYFSYGMESAAPAVLSSVNKRSSPERILEGIKAANDAGIGFGGNFIFGDPAETAGTIKETVSFFDQHCRSLEVYTSGIRPYPGSRLFQHCLVRNIIRDREAYYATIDRRYYNMTRFPSALWLIWVSVASHLAGVGAWLKAAKPFSEWKTWRDGLLIESWLVACPHCGKELKHDEARPQQIRERSAWRQSQIRLALWLCRIIGRFVPWYRAIETLTGEYRGESSLRSACPHCHKAFRVAVP